MRVKFHDENNNTVLHALAVLLGLAPPALLGSEPERPGPFEGRLVAAIAPLGFDSQAVADAINRVSPGDTIQLPAGTYELDEAIRPKSKIRLIGAGQGKSTLVYRGTKPSVLISLADCGYVELAHMTLDGQNSHLLHQGISGGNSRRLWLHHLAIRNLANIRTWGPHAILFSGHNPTMERGVTDSRITDCRIENIGVGAEYGGGIRLAWGCVRNQVLGNTIHKTGRGGIFGDHSAELVIRHNRVSGSGGEGLGIEIWGGCPRSLIREQRGRSLAQCGPGHTVGRAAKRDRHGRRHATRGRAPTMHSLFLSSSASWHLGFNFLD